MKIEFDTQNTSEIRLVAEILSKLGGQPVNDNKHHAQPEVASNAGTTASASSPTISKAEGSGVSGGGASALAPAAEKRRGRPPKAKEEAVQAAPAAPEAIKIVRPAPVPAPEPVEPEVDFDQVDELPPATLDDVRAGLQKFTSRHGMPDAIALLKTFNASRISELAVADYDAFIEACQA
jgi:hypothetical protein